MNKQELIEELECIEVSTDSLDYLRGADYANERAISLPKQLDEPKKVVVPKFVAEWIELCKGLECTLYCSATSKLRDTMHIEKAKEVSDWLDTFENHELFAHAWLDGYEVEKEQLYKVVIDHKYLVQLFSGRTDARLVEYEELTNWHDSAYKLTESVIKSIDERYWPFAVKAEDE
ncbi:DUF1642 domain-containing protein [Enterococcus faecalis]|uniref:DUF1642 domain-containing protein n=1 Tax=Enterococcus faecalis TaxID=1351 RepID=UPI0024BF449B|nr:DUF1642 domain-containing protein [Enterococcus faecalis]MDK0489054.1 DUF1642 domain-containing protein [Enterococcus faecalis]MDK0511113.1 DUF1642 domain-containing protein [Enterococcus faecalis]